MKMIEHKSSDLAFNELHFFSHELFSIRQYHYNSKSLSWNKVKVTLFCIRITECGVIIDRKESLLSKIRTMLTFLYCGLLVVVEPCQR